jgi:hypothetical protein
MAKTVLGIGEISKKRPHKALGETLLPAFTSELLFLSLPLHLISLFSLASSMILVSGLNS